MFKVHIAAITRPEELHEERVLRAGYFELLLESRVLNDEGQLCLTPGSAFLWHLEDKHLKPPEDLTYEALEASIHPQHKERIRRVWEAAKQKERDFTVNLWNLKSHWEKAPTVNDETIDRVLEETGTAIRTKLEKTLTALLAITPKDAEDSASMELESWQNGEKRLREGFYKLGKDQLVALRNYYEMLLERPKKDESQAEEPENPESYVLQRPLNDEVRQKIVNEVRYLRLISVVHQAIAIAKAAHHNQKSGRVRENGNIPYVYHPVAVMHDVILDAIVYFIKDEKLPLDFVMMIVAAALHDLLEDSGQSLDFIIDFFKTRADTYDSSIPIESGFGIPREEIQKKVLDLFGTSTTSNVRRILYIVSDNSPIDDQKKITALKKNWAGKHPTMSLLELTEKSINQWKGAINTDTISEEPQTRTFTEFPEEPRRGKMSRFLIKLSGVLKGDRDEVKRIGQAALILKMADRRHNLSTMEAKSPAQKLGQLRETVARLIAYAVLDHDQANYPLYNVLPQLIDTTLEQYSKIIIDPEAQKFINENDRTYIIRLQQWQREVRRYNVPEEQEKILQEYSAGRQAMTDEQLEAVSAPRRGLLGWLKSMGRRILYPNDPQNRAT